MTMDLNCANCSKLMPDAVELPCCKRSICGRCRYMVGLCEACPACAHAPLLAGMCKPSEALRTMVKAFLESRPNVPKPEHAKVAITDPQDRKRATDDTGKSTSETPRNSRIKERKRLAYGSASKTTEQGETRNLEVLRIPRAEFRSIFEDFEAIKAQALAILEARETGIPELDDLRTQISAVFVDIQNQEKRAAKRNADTVKAEPDGWELISNPKDGIPLVETSDSAVSKSSSACKDMGSTVALVELQSAKASVGPESKSEDTNSIGTTARVIVESWTEVGDSERQTELDASVISRSQDSKSGNSGGKETATEAEFDLLEEVLRCDNLLKLTTLVKRRNYIFLPSTILIYTRPRTKRIDHNWYWNQSCLHALGETMRMLWKMARHLLQVRTLTIKGSWDPSPSTLHGRIGKLAKHDVHHPATISKALRAEAEVKERIDACRYLAGLMVLMAKLESFAWETELPFSKVLWHALPIGSLQSLSINLKRDRTMKDVGEDGPFTIQDLQPLCSFINLRQLNIDGMERSYQMVIWQAVWGMPKLHTLSMTMAQPPCIKPELQRKWPMIDDNWRLRQDNGTVARGSVPLASNDPNGETRRVTEWVTEQIVRTCASSTDSMDIPARYRGDDGCGMLHPEFGYGEYLDEIAILNAKVKAGSAACYRIRVKTLKLGGFVVDAFPFVENFQHLTSLHLEHGCVDAGLVRPKGRVFEVLVWERGSRTGFGF